MTTHRAAPILALTLGMVVTGCASAPTAPSVMVLAGEGKSWEQFRTDDGACRQAAGNETSRMSGNDAVSLQQRYDMAYMQCMYAKGHQIPARTEAPSTPASSAAVPPGTPMAAPVTWPPTPQQIDCESSGGVWRAALNFCEFPSPQVPMRRW